MNLNCTLLVKCLAVNQGEQFILSITSIRRFLHLELAEHAVFGGGVDVMTYDVTSRVLELFSDWSTQQSEIVRLQRESVLIIVLFPFQIATRAREREERRKARQEERDKEDEERKERQQQREKEREIEREKEKRDRETEKQRSRSPRNRRRERSRSRSPRGPRRR